MSSSFDGLYFQFYSSNCFLFSSASQVSYLVRLYPAELQSFFLYISHSRGISRFCQTAFGTEGFDYRYSKRFASRLNSFEAPQVCQTACSAAKHLPEIMQNYGSSSGFNNCCFPLYIRVILSQEHVIFIMRFPLLSNSEQMLIQLINHNRRGQKVLNC